MEKWILFLKSQEQTADAHTTHRGRFLLAKGQEVARVLMWLLALSRLTLGSSAATGNLVVITARPHYVACLLLGSVAEPSRDCELDPWSFSFPPSLLWSCQSLQRLDQASHPQMTGHRVDPPHQRWQHGPQGGA